MQGSPAQRPPRLPKIPPQVMPARPAKMLKMVLAQMPAGMQQGTQIQVVQNGHAPETKHKAEQSGAQNVAPPPAPRRVYKGKAQGVASQPMKRVRGPGYKSTGGVIYFSFPIVFISSTVAGQQGHIENQSREDTRRNNRACLWLHKILPPHTLPPSRIQLPLRKAHTKRSSGKC